MKFKFLKNLEKLADITLTRKKIPVVMIYTSGNVYYVLDVILNSNFSEYYMYEVSKQDIAKFIEKKKNKYLLPKSKQLVYKIQLFNFEVLDMFKCDKENMEIFSFSEDEFECIDIKTLENHLKTLENELSTSK